MSELNKRTGGGGGAEYEVITQTVTVGFTNTYKDGVRTCRATLSNPFGKTGGKVELYGGGAYGLGTMAFLGNQVHFTNSSSYSRSFSFTCSPKSASLLEISGDGGQDWPMESFRMTLAFLMKS